LNAVGTRAAARQRLQTEQDAPTLVLVEVAPVVLLVGASLLIRTSLLLNAVDPGYDRERARPADVADGTEVPTTTAVDETARLASTHPANSGVSAASRRAAPPQGGPRIAVQHHRPPNE
jgi:hypothetical protein